MPIGARALAAPEPACTIPITRLIGNDPDGVLQLELDGVADRVAVTAASMRYAPVRPRNVGIEKAPERVNHIVRRELAAVVKQHALTQVRDVGQRIRLLERLGEVRHDTQLFVDVDKRVEEQLMNLL